ncbi:M3 family metallopeptidase [Paenibacillus apiarius]|uniref:M3 family metallopeptidase n=1 Tax=Paenibacillus apiarius TaxID=46240 RepID=UPI00197D5506|nr:M3 family metallopeptidase [Paenibacillus apiarius]MBN3527173.1 M3 family oligoendopeptidase [Paenibacillus apiarius]
MDVAAFLQQQNENMQKLSGEIAHAGWMATSTGENEWNDRLEAAQLAWKHYLSNPDRFGYVKKYKGDKRLDPLQQRQFTDLYNMMAGYQLDPELAARSTRMTKELVQIFNTYRPTMDGTAVTNNDIRTILETSGDQEERKRAWLASKQIGKRVETGVLQLIQQRNEEARALGYDNYYHMSYELQELDLDDTFSIFHDLLARSEEPYRLVKEEIDEDIARRFSIGTEHIQPWHYTDSFFQSAPSVGDWNLNAYLQGRSMEQITKDTFRSMGLDITDVMSNSDLYPRENKYPYGYCTAMGREGKPRVMMSIDVNEFWMSVMLHEFGHAAYEKYIDSALPFLLRRPAHTLTTEAIAMLFGRMTMHPDWIERFVQSGSAALSPHLSSLQETMRRQMLVSMRWYLTFTMFERELYERPLQHVNERWWQLAGQIQHLNAPEHTRYPDWAAKMHFALAPVSYQNYILGELTASQLLHYIKTNISQNMFTHQAGDYLKEHFFASGATWRWDEKLVKATGESLQPRYFVEQFIG